jgi:hypothetical protein
MRLALTFATAWILAATGSSAGESAPTFTAKPTATKAGDKVKIAFAVSAPTDVAVYIEDAKGEVVRHLVAGVLGQNPPAPLKPGLAQEVEWDGKADYDKPAAGGPFKVRVGLGLSAKYDKVLSSRPDTFAGASSLGIGPDGTLYLRTSSAEACFGHTQIVALNRDGGYRRTLLPFPSTAEGKEGRGLDVLELGGRPAPLRKSETDVASWGGPPYSSMAVSPDGKHLYSLSDGILRLSTELGSAEGHARFPPPKKVGAVPFQGFGQEACLAISSDGKWLFVSGLRSEPAGKLSGAVYRVKLPECAEVEAFFGEPGKAGADQSHLGATAAGLAVDGKGTLLVADPANKRVVAVSEADGKFLGEFKVDRDGLHGLGVDTRSGAVYGFFKGGVTKYSGWKDGRKVADIPFALKGWFIASRLAVDSSSDVPVIWASHAHEGQLVRVEDRGGKFEVKELSAGWRAGGVSECYLSMVVDRRTREVYVRNGGWGSRVERYDDATGKMEAISPADNRGGTGQGIGCQYVPAPNGNIYGLLWPYGFFQWDRKGQPVAWAEPRVPSADDLKNYDAAPPKGPHVAYVPVAMCAQPHNLGARWSDGHLFVIEPYRFGVSAGGRTRKALHEYLPTGKRVTAQDAPIVWDLSDAAIGPKFDAAGNIYVTEAVRPKGWIVPAEMSEALARKGVAVKPDGKPGDWYTCYKGDVGAVTKLYGSILKFGPRGGAVHWDKERASTDSPGHGNCPYTGELKLDPALKTVDVDYVITSGYLRGTKVTGAEWIHPGVSSAGFYRCNCENITFDVDEFGRVFFPDSPLFRVRVIDTAGNALTDVGGYGGPENCGPDSPVVDPGTKQLRARRSEDPKDLKSPFAEPEIALANPASVGVTDRHLYIGDPSNRRLLRTRLVYAAEETVTVP